MTDELIKMFSKFDLPNLIAMAIMFWIMWSKIEAKFEAFRQEIRADINAQSSRTDRLYEMYCDIRKENDQKWADCLREIKELRMEKRS